jgi:hypothetical protein
MEHNSVLRTKKHPIVGPVGRRHVHGRVWWAKGKNHLEDLDIDNRIMFTLIFQHRMADCRLASSGSRRTNGGLL